MITYILEIIGTIAFSVSGAVVGIKKKMDILGVATLGIITAVGGGILRDIIIGVVPPTAFRNPAYTLIAIAVAVLAFFPFVSRKINRIIPETFHFIDDFCPATAWLRAEGNFIHFEDTPLSGAPFQPHSRVQTRSGSCRKTRLSGSRHAPERYFQKRQW